MVTEKDAEKAAALVLAPRATRLPPPPPPEDEEEQGDEQQPNEEPEQNEPEPPPPPPQMEQPPEPPEPPEQKDSDDDSTQPTPDSGELLRDAVQAALPPNLLAQLVQNSSAGSMQGRVGEETPNMLRGRPRGARSGLPRGGARLHLLETLRAAAPWQRVRSRMAPPAGAGAPAPRVAVRREDFRIRRFIEKTGTTVLFVVDASGSSALYRLAEAKGAVELLLAETYARRDRVSLIAFRGQGTEVLLPPTRALARAKKVLAALPGGGGTPMAHAIDAAMEQAIATRRGGSSPLVVMMTDGRANIARDGTPGRKQAEQDALAAGARFASQHIPAMFVDTSPRGEVVARRLAEAMKARYILLPSADAKALGGLVKTAIQMAEGGG
jgi:magnesium chelatase subunit D